MISNIATNIRGQMLKEYKTYDGVLKLEKTEQDHDLYELICKILYGNESRELSTAVKTIAVVTLRLIKRPVILLTFNKSR